jgi:hypothetical protein
MPLHGLQSAQQGDSLRLFSCALSNNALGQHDIRQYVQVREEVELLKDHADLAPEEPELAAV